MGNLRRNVSPGWSLNVHELAVCQALLGQVEDLAQEHHATSVATISLQIGPLSGVEIPLLRNAWPLASAGSIAETAELLIDRCPIRVHCETCGAESEASINRLLCGECGDYHTRLLSGDEMTLAQIEFDAPVH